MTKKPKIPKCIYANWKYCWQRKGNSFSVREYGTPDTKECAACLTALVNWGEDATRRPITKDEMLVETGQKNLEKCVYCGKLAITDSNGRCQKCKNLG